MKGCVLAVICSNKTRVQNGELRNQMTSAHPPSPPPLPWPPGSGRHGGNRPGTTFSPPPPMTANGCGGMLVQLFSGATGADQHPRSIHLLIADVLVKSPFSFSSELVELQPVLLENLDKAAGDLQTALNKAPSS